MKLKEIFPEGVKIHCRTREEARELLALLAEDGYEWMSRAALSEKDLYEDYGEDTCYVVQPIVKNDLVDITLTKIVQISKYDPGFAAPAGKYQPYPQITEFQDFVCKDKY